MRCMASPVGDSLLMTVARRLARLIGPGDTLARVGGDQFALMTHAVRASRATCCRWPRKSARP